MEEHTILAIDDSGITLRMIKNMLEGECRTLLATSGKRALSILMQNSADLILLDIMMPEMDGFETYDAIRRFEDTAGRPHTPVIFLTGESGTDIERKGLKLGATDFIRKPLNKDILIERVQHALKNSATIKSLTEEATTDKLTGFLNKASGTAAISSMCGKYDGTLMVMDLDSFKLVNDLYGHETGDRVLRAFADIVRRNTRKSDRISRIGGDEFMGFFAGMTEKPAMNAFAERLNRQLEEEATKIMGEGNGIPLGISIGAVPVPEFGRTYEDLFALADGALYTAKQNGKHGLRLPRADTQPSTPGGLEGEIDRISAIIEERSEKGALILGGELFAAVNHFIERFCKRYGGSIVKILFSLTPKDSEFVSEACIQQFSSILQKSLRNSDLVMQHGRSQFFVILTGNTKLEADVAINRIVKKWNETEHEQKTALTYTYKEQNYKLV